ncbi:MAG: cytochrome c-type biogenesis protein [bacterium]
MRDASAQVETAQFETAQQESLYRRLLAELRCLVCANQSLSDSNADLAKDLRDKVRAMVIDGQGRDQIVAYLVGRYGEYVLYRPRFTAATFALWVGPFALFAVALIIAARRRARRRANLLPSLRRQRARALMEDDSK